MGLKELKQELSKLDKDSLINQIGELYKRFQPVKEYFELYLNHDEINLLEQYKQKVMEGFYPKRGYELKLSISRKAINDFKKLTPSSQSLADLMLYYVECGVKLTLEFGDIDEPFYNSVENTYKNALKLIYDKKLKDEFNDRAKKIVVDTIDCGWGFHDTLLDTYKDYYE